jgi:hypothetical protein
MKRHPPDTEDLIFQQEVNRKLGGRAKIDLHSVEREDGSKEYIAILSCGPHRHTILQTTPFLFDGDTEMAFRVWRWVGTLANPNSKWTTSLEQADAQTAH